MSAEPLPLAAAQARLGRPGRPRKSPEEKQAAKARKALQALHIQPRVLDVDAAAKYLSVSPWTVRDMIASGTLARVSIPGGPGRDVRRLLVDRAQLDELVTRWRA